METKRILIVDDEAPLRTALRAYLEREGYAVSTVLDGTSALAEAKNFQPDLVILDIMLPGMNGLEVLRRLRQHSDVYVLMLTAKADETDKVIGLGVGADDYMTKPFSPRELVARVQAVLRRARTQAPESRDMRFGRLRIDPVARQIWYDDDEIDFTPTEYELLFVLASYPRHVLSREQLIEQVWGNDFYGDERLIDVHIGRLRRKLENSASGFPLISTVRGVGYRFDGDRS